ncbi:MAG: hypothetical protein R2824_33290 [Saprospiraceae bacterium]
MKITGKVWVVTGGGSGMGRRLSQKYAFEAASNFRYYLIDGDMPQSETFFTCDQSHYLLGLGKKPT